jgi:hypothetical protein
MAGKTTRHTKKPQAVFTEHNVPPENGLFLFVCHNQKRFPPKRRIIRNPP